MNGTWVMILSLSGRLFLSSERLGWSTWPIQDLEFGNILPVTWSFEVWMVATITDLVTMYCSYLGMYDYVYVHFILFLFLFTWCTSHVGHQLWQTCMIYTSNSICSIFFIHMVPINHVGDLYLVETKHKANDSTC